MFDELPLVSLDVCLVLLTIVRQDADELVSLD